MAIKKFIGRYKGWFVMFYMAAAQARRLDDSFGTLIAAVGKIPIVATLHAVRITV